MGKTDIPRIVYMSKEDLSVSCFCVVSGVWFDFGGHPLLWFQLGWCLLSLVVFIQAAGAKLGAVRYSKSCRLSVRGQDITQKNLGPNLASKWHPRNRRFNSPYTFFTSGLVLKQQKTLETRQSSPWAAVSWGPPQKGCVLVKDGLTFCPKIWGTQKGRYWSLVLIVMLINAILFTWFAACVGYLIPKRVYSRNRHFFRTSWLMKCHLCTSPTDSNLPRKQLQLSIKQVATFKKLPYILVIVRSKWLADTKR